MKLNTLLRRFSYAALVALLILSATPMVAVAAPDDSAELRTHLEKGKAAFGLGRFADAAQEYEAAFALKPTATSLYNAAQAHRMAGHKERALELYQSYLRLYSKTGANRSESEQHVANLSAALAEEKRVATAPPNAMAAEPEAAAPVAVATPVPSAPASVTAAPPAESSLVATTTSAPEESGSAPWLWIGVGGAVVAVAAVVLLVTLGGSSAPEPSTGTIKGN
jgi:tetratricopeptide (TPR) repeat protein